jgi:hypothetical protein
MTRLLSIVVGVWMRLVTPAEPLHELTHALVAFPVAEDVGIERGPDGGAFARLEWPSDAPVVWVRIAHLAPTIVGTSSAIVAAVAFPGVVDVVASTGAWVAVSLGVPSAAGTVQLMLGAVIVVNWVVFSIPSPEDLRPFE